MLLSVGVAKESFRRTACVWLGFGLALLLFGPTGIRPRPVEAERPPRVSAWVPAVPAETAARSDMSVVPAPDPRWPMLFVRGYSDDKPTIWVCRGDGTEQRKLVENGRSPCWSPDHQQFAFVRDNQVWLADADGRNQRQLTAIPYGDRVRDDSEFEIRVSWDRVNDLITFSYPEHYALVSLDETVSQPSADDPRPGDSGPYRFWSHSIFDVRPIDRFNATPHARYRVYERFGLYGDFKLPTWSPNGQVLAMTCNGDIWLARRGERVWQPEEDRPDDPVWTPWNLPVQNLIPTADHHEGWHSAWSQWHRPSDLSWSPDSRRLAYTIRPIGAYDDTVIRIATIVYPKYGDATVVADEMVVRCGADGEFSPDGRFLAFAGTADPDLIAPEHAYDGIVVMAIDGDYRRLLVHDGCQPAW